MSKKVQNTIRGSLVTAFGTPAVYVFLTEGGMSMDSSAFTFTVALSIISMFVIAGVAFMGAYKFLKNVGLFKGHYYY